MAINRGLGKGLSALFSDTDAEYEYSSQQNRDSAEENSLKPAEGQALYIPINKISANIAQPRKNFDRAALEELAGSIKEHGIIQPLVLTAKKNGYMIVAGERRFRAAIVAGLKEVPAIIKDYTEKEIKEIALIENLQREDLNPIESATAIKALMEEHNLTQEELSQRIGKSRPAIANLVRLLSLPAEILDMVKHKKLSEGHARCLIGIEREKAIEIAQKAAEMGLSVRETEKAAKAQSVKAPAFNYSQKQPPQKNRELQQLVSDMQRVFGTKVSAMGNEQKGRISIDYYSPDDIGRIFDIVEKLKR